MGMLPERPAPGAGRRRGDQWILPCFCLGCSLFLFLETFVPPFTPRAAAGDQAIYLHNAARMFEGQMIYRDYDHFTPPGTDVLYFALFRLFGIRAWIPQALLVVVGVLIVYLSFKICRHLLSGPAAYLAGLLFLVLPFTGYLDATHHWYSTLAAMAALAVLMQERTPFRLAWAGALWGLGTCFAQSLVLGPVGLALFLVWERRRRKESGALLLRKEASVLVGYLGVIAGFNSYFVWKVGWHRFVYYTLIFVAKYYPADSSNTWRAYMAWRPSLHLWTDWPELPAWGLIHFIVPMVYLLFFVRYWRDSRRQVAVPWERLMLVNITGLSMFLMVASAAAYNRLYTVALPALILLVWFLDSPFKLERALLRCLWVLVALLAVVKPVVTQMRWKAVLDLPTGRTAFFSPVFYEKTKWLLQRTRPSDYFFGDQFVGFALKLRNPGRIAFVTSSDYTRPEEVSDLLQGLERHQVRFVSWYGDLDNVPTAPRGDHLGPLRRYLREHYRVAETFSNGDEIWERKPESSED